MIENGNMNKQENNIMRNVLTQLSGKLSDSAFTAIVAANNLPLGLTLGAAQAVARGAVQGVMQNCYDDIQQRKLSQREVAKHNLVFDVAERMYFDLAANDIESCSPPSGAMDDSYYRYVYETAEHVSIEAIRQSEMKKVEVLGRFYGREFYKHGWELDFQDMHQMISMIGTLTFRQIVLIRLIAEGFKGYDSKLFVTNPTACVEINRLKDYGIWQTEGAAFGVNESWHLQLGGLIPTKYSEQVNEALMLDCLSGDDLKRAVESLRLTTKGEATEMLTKEEFDSRTTFKVEGETLVLPGGKVYGKDEDEEQFLFDVARGK